jgi:hypothetical protein
VRSRFWVAVLIPCSLLLAHDDHDDEKETFQSLISLIVRSAREKLRPLKTFRIEARPSNDYWYEVTDTLPGADCRIYEHPRMVYQCVWTSAKPGGPASQSGLIDEIRKASPEMWTVVRHGASQVTLEPREARRYPLMEIVGERSSTTGMILRIFAVARD